MSKVEIEKYNNSWYTPSASSTKCLIWYFVNVLIMVNPLNPFSCLRIWVLRLFGAKIGKGVRIKPSVNVKYPWLLTIGNFSWIGERVWIDNLEEVIIGNNVCISQGAMLLCCNHNYKSSMFDLLTGKIKLEDGVWVCAQSVVCPGVTMYSHSVLGINSVASHDIDAYSIYSGIPAIKIRNRIIR